jgi:hypothetical protein
LQKCGNEWRNGKHRSRDSVAISAAIVMSQVRGWQYFVEI